MSYTDTQHSSLTRTHNTVPLHGHTTQFPYTDTILYLDGCTVACNFVTFPKKTGGLPGSCVVGGLSVLHTTKRTLLWSTSSLRASVSEGTPDTRTTWTSNCNSSSGDVSSVYRILDIEGQVTLNLNVIQLSMTPYLSIVSLINVIIMMFNSLISCSVGKPSSARKILNII